MAIIYHLLEKLDDQTKAFLTIIELKDHWNMVEI